MNPTDVSWVTILSALLTPAIAVSVTIIAYRQWRTAQNRLKLDLFDRCLAIHTAALGIILRAVNNPTGSIDVVEFKPAVRQSRWLLDKEIERYFRQEFIPKVIDFHILWSPNTKSDTEERREIFQWMVEQEDVLDTKFDRFLKIKT